MKDLSPGTVVFGVFAILAGLLTAYGVRKAMEKPAPAPVVEAVAPAQKMIKVVVPIKNLPEYSVITPSDVSEIAIPVSEFPKEYQNKTLPNKARSYYRVTKKTILSNNPILEEDLYAIGEDPTIGSRLNEGETALTLKMTTDQTNNGMVRPETRVNILLTLDRAKTANMGNLDNLSTVTLMKNVRILSTSYARLPSPEGTEAISNVTFAVTPVQASKLTVAEKYGNLSLTLCAEDNSSEDATDSPEDFMDIYSILGVDRPTPPGPAVVELSAKKYTDNWSGSGRTGRVYDEWETLEALNATRVAHGEPALKRVPRERTTVDNIPETFARPASNTGFEPKLVVNNQAIAPANSNPANGTAPANELRSEPQPTTEPAQGDQASAKLPSINQYGNLGPAI